jgi:hypothetical protein
MSEAEILQTERHLIEHKLSIERELQGCAKRLCQTVLSSHYRAGKPGSFPVGWADYLLRTYATACGMLQFTPHAPGDRAVQGG